MNEALKNTSGRLAGDWVTTFVQETEGLPSPPQFRQWSAIATVAGALERHVWCRVFNMNIYPNMYTFLVAPPGVGKTVATNLAESFWRLDRTRHVAPKSVTRASFGDALADAKKSRITPLFNPPVQEYNSLLVHAGELGVFVPGWDSEFMSLLTDVWDGRMYEETRRGNKLHIRVEKPTLNILASTTPSYLMETLPEGAWDQGFLSRTLLIYSEEPTAKDPFGSSGFDYDDISRTKLAGDLRRISNLFGPYKFDKEAEGVIRNWHMSGGHPAPEHPKLLNYNTRRTAHLLKLCMVSAASRGDELVITLPHVDRAMRWLTQAEARMPDIFKAMAGGGDSKVMEDAWYFLYNQYIQDKQPIPQGRLVAFLSQRAPSHAVLKIMELMLQQGIVKAVPMPGYLGFIPQSKMGKV